MKQLFLSLSFLFLLFTVACNTNTQDNNATDEPEDTTSTVSETVETEADTPAETEGTVGADEVIINEDFTAFWKEFQQMVANNDKEAIVAITDKEYVEESGFTGEIDPKAKEQIANPKMKDFIKDSETAVIYSVTLSEETDPETGEYHSSSLNFYFEKEGDKWILSVLDAAG